MIEKATPPGQAVFISSFNQHILGKKHTNKLKFNNLIIIQQVIIYLQQKAFALLK